MQKALPCVASLVAAANAADAVAAVVRVAKNLARRRDTRKEPSFPLSSRSADTSSAATSHGAPREPTVSMVESKS